MTTQNLHWGVWPTLVVAFATGWAACEKARVAPKDDTITQLQKKIDSGPNYQQQIDMLTEKNRDQTLRLEKSTGELKLWQDLVKEWQVAKEKVDTQLQVQRNNCQISSMIDGLRSEKNYAEQNVLRFEGSKDAEDYRRQAQEYQESIKGLESKLACSP